MKDTSPEAWTTNNRFSILINESDFDTPEIVSEETTPSPILTSPMRHKRKKKRTNISKGVATELPVPTERKGPYYIYWNLQYNPRKGRDLLRKWTNRERASEVDQELFHRLATSLPQDALETIRELA